MEPDSFDDVSYRFLEHPDEEPPRPPRRRRRMLAAAGLAVLSAGALAAGASALGGGEARDAAPARSHDFPAGWTSYAPLKAHGGHSGLCHRPEGRFRPEGGATASGPRT
jgi:hypothetical protein